MLNEIIVIFRVTPTRCILSVFLWFRPTQNTMQVSIYGHHILLMIFGGVSIVLVVMSNNCCSRSAIEALFRGYPGSVPAGSNCQLTSQVKPACDTTETLLGLGFTLWGSSSFHPHLYAQNNHWSNRFWWVISSMPNAIKLIKKQAGTPP